MDTIKLPQAKDIKKIPKDETSEAIIVNLEVTTWKELTVDPEKKKTASEDEVLKITYDAKGFIRNEAFGLPTMLTNASKYGRFIEKYNKADDSEFQPFIGMKIKVLFIGEGKTNILIAE